MNTFDSATTQFGDFSKNVVDAAVKFARVSLESAERIAALNLEAAKVGLEEGSKSAKSIAAVKDVQELNNVRTKAAETGLEFFMGYSKNFYELSTSAQQQYASLFEGGVASFQKTFAENLDKAAKSAPAGTDGVFTALKSGLAISAAATDTFTKAGRQFSNMADGAFKTATETATKATASAKRK
jgi:phasin family protein